MLDGSRKVLVVAGKVRSSRGLVLSSSASKLRFYMFEGRLRGKTAPAGIDSSIWEGVQEHRSFEVLQGQESAL